MYAFLTSFFPGHRRRVTGTSEGVLHVRGDGSEFPMGRERHVLGARRWNRPEVGTYLTGWEVSEVWWSVSVCFQFIFKGNEKVHALN